MSFAEFCQKLNESPWQGSICEVGVGVPFQAKYLNISGASKTILFAHTPYHRAFQIKDMARAVSENAAISLAWRDLNKVRSEFKQDFIFALATSGSHKKPDEDGDTHGWISLVSVGANQETKTVALHWQANKSFQITYAGESATYPLSREAVGEYLSVLMAWFLEKTLLNTWSTWGEAIQNYPEALKKILWVDVIQAADMTMTEHLSLVQPNQPLVFFKGQFRRPTEFLRRYNRCYRGSFNPPTLAHEAIGVGALFEVSVDNARKGKMTLDDLKHRIRMIDLIERPVLITSGVPLFVDLHKMLLKRGATCMEYLVGVDTFNAIVDSKYIRQDDLEFFRDFEVDNLKQSGKFLVIPRSDLAPVNNSYAQRIEKVMLTVEEVNHPLDSSSTAVRNGDLTLVSEKVKGYILEHGIYSHEQ